VSDTGDYILGTVGLLAIVLTMAIAGRTTRRAALQAWGAPAVLADAVIAIGYLVVISEVLALRDSRRGPARERLPDRREGRAARADADPCRQPSRALGPGQESDQREAPSVSRLELGVAVVITLIVAAQWAGPTLLALDRGIYGGDSLWYHMPLAAHIAQAGSVTSLLYPDPLYLNWFYPQVSELIHAGGSCSTATTSSRRCSTWPGSAWRCSRAGVSAVPTDRGRPRSPPWPR
jgi:hypothetical protein